MLPATCPLEIEEGDGKKESEREEGWELQRGTENYITVVTTHSIDY